MESAIYLRLFSNSATGNARKDWVKVFFEQERLPVEEGWETPPEVIDGFALAKDILQLALATPGEDLTTMSNLTSRGARSYHGVA